MMPLLCAAQDPCNNLKWDLEKGSFAAAYTSPKAPVMASKRVLADDTSLYLTFTIEGKSVTPVNAKGEVLQAQVRGLKVGFEDGSTFQLDTATVASRMLGGKSVYNYAFRIDEEAFQIFTSRKISQFSLGGLTETKPRQSGFIPDYLKCLQKRRF